MKTLLIIGGGIGGLTAAACFHARSAGRVQPIVYERAEELKEVGAAIAVWPNAGRILKHLGLLEKLMPRSYVAPAGALRDASGQILKRMLTADGKIPVMFAHRAELLAAILSAVPSDSIHLGKRCVNIERGEQGVRAVFADNTFSPWANGLIGADGIHSIIREKTIADGNPLYRGYVAWRGVATFESEEIVGETWGRGKRFGFIPLGNGRVGWWAAANDPTPEETLKRTPPQWKSDVLKLFGEWHLPIRQVIEATPAESVLCNAIADRPAPPPNKPWGEGAVSLLGDAAHPTTPNLGQGACMAIEDAAVLAYAVDAIPEVPTALRVYEATRTERTAKIVTESLKFGRIGQWKNPLACAARKCLIRFGPERRLRKQFQELWNYDAWNVPLLMPA